MMCEAPPRHGFEKCGGTHSTWGMLASDSNDLFVSPIVAFEPACATRDPERVHEFIDAAEVPMYTSSEFGWHLVFRTRKDPPDRILHCPAVTPLKDDLWRLFH